ncbi:MAG: CsgG/HfaB family protein [Gemmatimonadaceae bacterium]|nr:CsgG/HfaB family protein [Gemmatimonadaceae bacterium]
MYQQIARATTLVALVAATAVAQQADTRPTVAVLPFTNSAIGQNNADLQALSKGIADLLLTELSQNPGIRVVERENIANVIREQGLAADGRVDEATAVRAGRLLGAKHMVTGTFITDNRGTMVLTLKSIDSETGIVEWSHTGRGKTESFFELVSQVAAAANSGLKLPALTPQVRQTGEARTEERKKIPFQAVMMYSRAISAQDNGKKEEAIELFSQTIQRFPTFSDAVAACERLEGGARCRPTGG